jgi:hypothetical protein
VIGGGGKGRVIARWLLLPVAVGVVSLGRVATATRGGRRRGKVEWKIPNHHAVAAHWPNIPDSLV